MAFDSIGQAEDQGDGISELDKAPLESFSFDFTTELEEKPTQKLSPGERGVNGFNTDNAAPKSIGALSNLQLEDENSVPENGFMSECDIQALIASLYLDGNRPQVFRSEVHDREYRSLFSIPSGDVFRHSASMRPDVPVNDLAWILNQSPAHQASQSFSDQFLNAPETTRLGRSSFSGLEPIVRLPPIRTSLRENYSNMLIHNASEPTAHFDMPSHPGDEQLMSVYSFEKVFDSTREINDGYHQDSLFSGICRSASLGEGFDLGRMNIQGRSQFQRPEMQMTNHYGNEAAAGLNAHLLDLRKAHLLAQLRQHETESYMSNFVKELQHNPPNLTRDSMAQAVNGPRDLIIHDRRFSPSRNGGGFLLEAMKIDEVCGLGLADIVGHVAEFSMDQWGSRLIQMKLETTSEDDKNLIFPEISLYARELMTDIFGNYVIQKFLEFGNATQRSELVDQLHGRVLNLSLHMYGCRVVQKALDVANADQTTKIVAELSGAVIKCAHDQNGNHVIQKCIESIPEDRIQSIITAFYGQVPALSTHPYGCRVIQRVVDYCNDQKSRETVFGEIFENVLMLAQTQYGNYVVQRLVLHGKPHERHVVVKELAAHIVTMSMEKFGSNVIETCLGSCSPEERRLFVNEILKPSGKIEPLQALMQDRFGNYVVQKMLNTCSQEELELILPRVKVNLKSLKRNIGNKNISRIEQLVITAERRLRRKSIYK